GCGDGEKNGGKHGGNNQGHQRGTPCDGNSTICCSPRRKERSCRGVRSGGRDRNAEARRAERRDAEERRYGGQSGAGRSSPGESPAQNSSMLATLTARRCSSFRRSASSITETVSHTVSGTAPNRVSSAS